VRIACFVATIITTITLRNAALSLPTSLIPPICSILVLCIHPIHWTTKSVATAPAGVLPILAGFILLAIGAWHSLRKPPATVEIEK